MPILFLETTSKDRYGGIEKQNFDMFLQICFSRATRFSMSKCLREGYETVPNAAEVRLSKYLIKTISPISWYGYEDIQEKMVQNLYQANCETMQVLRENYEDVFLSSKKRLKKVPIDTIGRKPKQVSTFENLCFFSGNQMILGTLSHEIFCSTNEIDVQFADELMKIGKWNVSEKTELGIESILV